jgi:hypothetical protein
MHKIINRLISLLVFFIGLWVMFNLVMITITQLDPFSFRKDILKIFSLILIEALLFVYIYAHVLKNKNFKGQDIYSQPKVSVLFYAGVYGVLGGLGYVILLQAFGLVY